MMSQLFGFVPVALWIILTAYTAVAADQNTFESREAGIKITKPADWHFMPAKAAAQNLALPKLRNREVEKEIRSKPNISFLVIARYQEPYAGVNPSVQVTLKTQGELVGKGAVSLLTKITDRLKGSFGDFTFVEPVAESMLDGNPAARMAASYTVTDADGREFKTRARMWVVPRGDYMLTISMAGSNDGPNVSEKEFGQILQSIRIAKP
ncbi:MAG: hypothetical protein EXS31_09920 [Pedosphaera sp.]|nr:hypothetical protein [Pedosphaera sp.]